MEKKNNDGNKRKVSFAPKEATTYTYQEQKTTVSNTSCNDSYTIMDITADYSRYGNNEVFGELSTETVRLTDIIKEGMSSNSDARNAEGKNVEPKEPNDSLGKNNETTYLNSSTLSSLVTDQAGDECLSNQNLLSINLKKLVQDDVNILAESGKDNGNILPIHKAYDDYQYEGKPNCLPENGEKRTIEVEIENFVKADDVTNNDKPVKETVVSSQNVFENEHEKNAYAYINNENNDVTDTNSNAPIVEDNVMRTEPLVGILNNTAEEKDLVQENPAATEHAADTLSSHQGALDKSSCTKGKSKIRRSSLQRETEVPANSQDTKTEPQDHKHQARDTPEDDKTVINDDKENVQANSKRKNSTSSATRKPRTTLRRKSVDGSFNNTLMSDNTVYYEEICNTQDLRKIFQPKPKTNVSELLMNYGIKFFDSIILNSTRRSTFSRPINCNDPATNMSLEYCKSKQVDFYMKYSEELEKRIAKLADANKQTERDFENAEITETHKLKSLKEECRIRAKNAGIEFRRAQMMNFNFEILNSKTNLQEKLSDAASEISKLETQLSVLKVSTATKSEKIRAIRERMSKTSKEYEPDYLKGLISDQEKLIKSLNEELKAVTKEVRNKEASWKSIKEEIEAVTNENIKLKQNLKSKNVTENEVIELKNEYKVQSSVVGINILGLDTNTFKFGLLGYEFDLRYDELAVSNFDVRCIEESPIHEYGLSAFTLQGLPFKEAMHTVVTICNRISYLFAQIRYLEAMYNAKVCHSDKKVTVTMNLMDVKSYSTAHLKFVISEGFTCSVEDAIGNLNEDSDFMLNYLEKIKMGKANAAM